MWPSKPSQLICRFSVKKELVSSNDDQNADGDIENVILNKSCLEKTLICFVITYQDLETFQVRKTI